jgi:hypothetical protein
VHHHSVVRAGVLMILFRIGGLGQLYLIRADATLRQRLALFVPAAVSHAGVLAAVVGAFYALSAAVPTRRRAVVGLACVTFALLMIAGQADFTVSAITGAPLTPTVFRTYRGLQVVGSNEFLEPLRAHWPATVLGAVLFVGVVLGMLAVVVAAERRPRAGPAWRGAASCVAGGVTLACLTSWVPWPIPPPPIEAAFAREYFGLDATRLSVAEPVAVEHLRTFLGLPPGARWMSDRYPVVYRPPAAAPARRGALPDIVVVMIESLRAEELSFVTGRPDSATPNLDALAAHSVVFPVYLSNAFPSAPSVLAFHASAWPHRRKEIATDFSDRGFDSIPARLRDLGYETVYVGADPHFDHQDRWLAQWYSGVSDLVASGTAATDHTIVARAIAEIRRHDTVQASKPLFAFVSTYSTHYPFRSPADAGGTFGAPDASLEGQYRRVLKYADAQLGALLRALSERVRRQRTVTIVVGDHSFYTNLRRTSGLPENDNEWTAGVIAGPADLVGPPRRVTDPVSHVDMLPTILAMVGDDRPTAALGSDLFGPPRTLRRSVLSVRPGGLRFDRDGYCAMVDLRLPNGEDVRPSVAWMTPPRRPNLPTAAQLIEWVDDWSYLIERNRVWSEVLLHADPPNSR